jgi:hypothetical protein
MTNMDALLKTVDAATAGLDFTYDRLQSGTFGRKEGLVTTFAVIALGLNRGLICLARYSLTTAAFALERPITETVMRALWIYFCASEEDIDRIVADDDKVYGHWIEMHKAVDTALGQATDEKAAREIWRRLNSATHTGADHLRNHISEDGRLEPQYTTNELISLVRSTTGLVVLLLLLQIASSGREDLAAETRDVYATISDLHEIKTAQI